MSELFDLFPSNIGESLGRIDRKPFKFRYQKIEVWQGGKCIFKEASNGLIEGVIENENLLVSLDDSKILPFMKSKFSFGEISTNLDRIMWSKDIFDTRDSIEKFCPDISSFFYK